MIRKTTDTFQQVAFLLSCSSVVYAQIKIINGKAIFHPLTKQNKPLLAQNLSKDLWNIPS